MAGVVSPPEPPKSGVIRKSLLSSSRGRCEGPTAASKTLSAIFVTTATCSSNSNTIEPTSPNDTDGVVINNEGWLAGLTPVRFPVDAVFAYDVYAAP
jgi:hypothetical protein